VRQFHQFASSQPDVLGYLNFWVPQSASLHLISRNKIGLPCHVCLLYSPFLRKAKFGASTFSRSFVLGVHIPLLLSTDDILASTAQIPSVCNGTHQFNGSYRQVPRPVAPVDVLRTPRSSASLKAHNFLTHICADLLHLPNPRSRSFSIFWSNFFWIFNLSYYN
jgi:hypothetical protein